MISLIKANNQIRTEKLEIKKISKIFKIALFRLFQNVAFIFRFIYHQYGSKAHLGFQKKTLKFISVSSKNIGDEKSCQKIAAKKIIWSLLFFFP